MPTTATAVRIHETGGPEVLQVESIDLPDPGPGEVLVDVHATGVNFIDTYHRSGLYEVALPFVPGSEGAGVIAVSPGPIKARHMWLKPSFEPRQTMTSDSGSSRTPYFVRYLLATSRRRFKMPFDLL